MFEMAFAVKCKYMLASLYVIFRQSTSLTPFQTLAINHDDFVYRKAQIISVLSPFILNETKSFKGKVKARGRLEG